MQPSSVVSLYSRRGSILLWEHAHPPARDDVDPFTGSVKAAVGGPRKEAGPFGEIYGAPYEVNGYLQSKITTVFTEVYGMVDDRTMQLTLPVQRPTDLTRGIRPLPIPLQEAYTKGHFLTFERKELVARDRFTHNGIRWIVKSAAVPLIDLDTTLAWRILVAAQTL